MPPAPQKTAVVQPDWDLAGLESRFTVVTTTVEIAGRRWELRRPKSCEDLISEEDFDRDDRLPYWAEIWPSAQVLAGRIGRLDGAGRRLLELGCGVGLVAMAAAEAGFLVTATDYYSEALEFTVNNALHNSVPGISTRLVDWRRVPDDLGQFDVIVASDVLYERPNAALVAAVLLRALAPRGLALVSDPGRLPAAPFSQACESLGLETLDVEANGFTDGKTSLTVYVYEIRRRVSDAANASKSNILR